MNATSARCGHVKRRLVRGERLTGKLLEFALDIFDGEPSCNELFSEIASKLRSGTTLDDYELHIVCDVVLLHVRLAGRASQRLEEAGSQPT